jgi:hypothetical protein
MQVTGNITEKLRRSAGFVEYHSGQLTNKTKKAQYNER